MLLTDKWDWNEALAVKYEEGWEDCKKKGEKKHRSYVNYVKGLFRQGLSREEILKRLDK